MVSQFQLIQACAAKLAKLWQVLNAMECNIVPVDWSL